jgi:cell division septation protein DedD
VKPGAARFSIQVASFRTRSRADEVLAAVSRRTGQPGLVLTSDPADSTSWHALLLGAFATEGEARAVAETLRAEGTISEIILRVVPEAWLDRMTVPAP